MADETVPASVTIESVKTMTGLRIEEALARLDEQLPADAYKPVPGGVELTDIDPNWMRKVLNEVFGLCGFGWGYKYASTDLTTRVETRYSARGDERMVIVATLSHLEFWYRLAAGSVLHFCTVHASGGSENSTPAYAMKGAITSALGNAASNLGFQESVYLGRRDHKTVKAQAKSGTPTTGSTRSPNAANSALPGSSPVVSALPVQVGDVVVAIGTKHNGKKLNELSEAALVWFANQDGKGMIPANDAARLLQEQAKTYLMSRPAPAA